MKIIKISAEEAQAFRERVKKQNEEIARMVVIDTDEFIKRWDEWTSCEMYGHEHFEGFCRDCGDPQVT